MLIFYLVVTLVGLVWSRIGAYDPFTWLLEVLPVMLGIVLLIATRRRFPLTPLLYFLLFVHALILIVGGHYTYARVPAGYWVQDLFGWERNPYDRLGHVAQGFVPAILAREILIRTSPLGAEDGTRSRWLFFLVACVCLAFSAFYELLEWWAAVLAGSGAEGLPRYPGRRVGHTVGHVPRALGCVGGPAAARLPA